MSRPATLAVLACLAALGPGSAAARAQTPELVTDRPDQTESSEVVAPGSVQIEIGAGHSRAEEAGADRETTEIGSTLVRIGLVERLELRLGWGGLIDESSAAGPDASGAADMDLGVKLRLAEEDGSRPALALLASSSLPLGGDEVSSDHSDPSLLLSASHTLSESVGLGYNVGAAWETAADESGDRDTTYDWLYSLAVGVGIDDRLGAFGEVFGRVPGSSGGRSEASLDGGLTYLVRPNRQLDLFAGIGLGGAAADWFFGLGLSIRLPE